MSSFSGMNMSRVPHIGGNVIVEVDTAEYADNTPCRSQSCLLASWCSLVASLSHAARWKDPFGAFMEWCLESGGCWAPVD